MGKMARRKSLAETAGREGSYDTFVVVVVGVIYEQSKGYENTKHLGSFPHLCSSLERPRPESTLPTSCCQYLCFFRDSLKQSAWAGHGTLVG